MACVGDALADAIVIFIRMEPGSDSSVLAERFDSTIRVFFSLLLWWFQGSSEITLPKFNSSPLKNGVTGRRSPFPLGFGNFSGGELLNFGDVI